MAMTIRASAPLNAEAVLPLTLLLQHLKDPEDEDLLVDAARQGAVAWIEQHVNRSLTRRDWKAFWTTAPAYAGPLRLPMGPVASITAVTYGDPAQVWPVLSYRLAGDEVVTGSGQAWSAAFAGMPFAVEYVAGYDDVSIEAPAICSAALLLAGHLYRNREENSATVLTSMPFGVKMLCEPYRQPVIA